jgi:biopolymer transport protein ExbD/biopolymer transport protein TolR
MAGGIGGTGLGRRRAPTLNADINVTSLVDVAFVLLIIFMITAPMLQGGVDVELPKAKSVAMSSRDAVIVTVNRQGRIFIGEIPVTQGEFQATIRRLMDQKNANSVYVRGDRNATYGSVIRVLSALHEAGITGASMVVEEEDIAK